MTGDTDHTTGCVGQGWALHCTQTGWCRGHGGTMHASADPMCTALQPSEAGKQQHEPHWPCHAAPPQRMASIRPVWVGRIIESSAAEVTLQLC